VQAKIGMASEDRGPFVECLLDAAFAEIALAGGDQRLDLLGASALGDGDQLDVGGVTPGERSRLGDIIENRLASVQA